jgi:hypothetical protein
MYRFAAGGPIDVQELRERFRRMADEQLLRKPDKSFSNVP